MAGRAASGPFGAPLVWQLADPERPQPVGSLAPLSDLDALAVVGLDLDEPAAPQSTQIGQRDRIPTQGAYGEFGRVRAGDFGAAGRRA